MQRTDQTFGANGASSGKTASQASRLFETVENIISFHLNGALIFSVMAMISTEILSRYFFGFSFMGVVDMVELTMLVLAFASLSGVQREGRHIKVDLIEKKLNGRLSGLILHLFNQVLTLLVSVVLLYIALRAVLEAYQDNILTWMIFMPKWPAVLFIPIGWFLMCVRVGIQIKQIWVDRKAQPWFIS